MYGSESTQAVLVTDILARMVCSEFTQAVLITDILQVLARMVCSESTQAVLVTDIVATQYCIALHNLRCHSRTHAECFENALSLSKLLP